MHAFNSLLAICTLLLTSQFLLAEELSFEEWEASMEAQLSGDKSSLETINLEPATSEELSDAAISDALQTRSIDTNKPAYESLDEEQSEQREADSNSLIEEQQTDLSYSDNNLPAPDIYDQPIFSHPNGRELQHNNTAFER